MARIKKGLVHIYTGNGKGKTTAALGLAVRAAGAGLCVSIQQFIKGREYSEIKGLGHISGICIKQCGMGCFIKRTPKISDIECAIRGLQDAKEDIMSCKFDVIILDEINVAMDLGLIKVSAIIELIKNKPACVELVLTGRNCPRKLYRYADYVSCIREVKHPYKNGIKARIGIEC